MDPKDGFGVDAIGSKSVRAHSPVGGVDKGVAGDQQKPRSIIISTCRDVVHSTRYLVPHPPLATSRTVGTTTTVFYFIFFFGGILVTSVPIQQNLKSLSLLFTLSPLRSATGRETKILHAKYIPDWSY